MFYTWAAGRGRKGAAIPGLAGGSKVVALGAATLSPQRAPAQRLRPQPAPQPSFRGLTVRVVVKLARISVKYARRTRNRTFHYRVRSIHG